MHRQGYRAPEIRRVYIPKPGKQEKRPLGVPCVSDRALQRSTAQVLSAIYEQDFLPCSFGGRPGQGAHHALATFNEVIAGGKVGWVLEADLKNFFGSLSHEWVLRFVEHRVGDPRMISLIRRWLKAGVLEDGEVHPNEEGTPQGGSISVLLSNLYLHYVLDLWFERVVKPRLQGEAYLVRYIDDFVLCFQYREDALRVQDALCKRLGRFGLTLEPTKTKLVEFGRFAQTNARRRGGNARRRSTFWASRSTAREIRRAISRLGCAPRNHACGAVLPPAGPDADRGTYRSGNKQQPQQGATRPLCLLRHCREFPSTAKGISGRGALLAQNAVQPESERPYHVGCVPPDQGTDSVMRPKLYLPYGELQAIAVL